jgi:REP-associated tyrosine transposase
LLISQVEGVVHQYLRGRCINTPDVFIDQIGGIETHVYLCLSVALTVLISEFIGQLKGASSHEANQKVGNRGTVLEWQAGYGVVSFGTRDLAWVHAYVRDQRQRHGRGAVEERLERITTLEDRAEAKPPGSPVNGAQCWGTCRPTRRQRRAYDR